MKGHTPGPWHVTKSPAPREIRADSGPFIASVYDVAVTYGERNANARLLAAAPELLDALKLLMKAYESVLPGLANIAVQDYALINDAPVAAERAIAKVEGR